MTIRLFTRSFKSGLRNGTRRGTRRAAGKLKTLSRRKVNRKFHRRKRIEGRMQNKGNTGASRPGEPPKRRTGAGYYSIESRPNAEGARTYSAKSKAPYMARFEFDRDPKWSRPWMKPAFTENKALLRKLIMTPVRRRLRK